MGFALLHCIDENARSVPASAAKSGKKIKPYMSAQTFVQSTSGVLGDHAALTEALVMNKMRTGKYSAYHVASNLEELRGLIEQTANDGEVGLE